MHFIDNSMEEALRQALIKENLLELSGFRVLGGSFVVPDAAIREMQVNEELSEVNMRCEVKGLVGAEPKDHTCGPHGACAQPGHVGSQCGGRFAAAGSS